MQYLGMDFFEFILFAHLLDSVALCQIWEALSYYSVKYFSSPCSFFCFQNIKVRLFAIVSHVPVVFFLSPVYLICFSCSDWIISIILLKVFYFHFFIFQF